MYVRKKKELKIKYELENNLRLVSFKDQKIEISFSSDLEKIFVKELTAKLLEWTNKRWIIAFSKENGMPTLKEQKKNIIQNMSISLFSDATPGSSPAYSVSPPQSTSCSSARGASD